MKVFFDANDKYYVFRDGNLIHIRNQHDILKTFAHKKADLKAFRRENKLHNDDFEGSARTLIQFYDTLPQD